MLKTDYPVIFDETTLNVKWRRWARMLDNIANTNQTEGGYDSVEYVRFGKSTINAQLRCTSDMASTLAGFSNAGAISVKFYDLGTKAYVTLSMHMENFTATLVRESEISRTSNGVYDVSFSLVEF